MTHGQPTLLRTDGRAVQTPACDALTWRDAQGVFEIRPHGRIGWLREDASVWMAPEWQELEPLFSGYVAARLGRHWGLLDGQSGALRIPCAFDKLEAVSLNGEGCAAWLKVGQRVGRRSLRWGIWRLDAGRQIVDCLYRHIYPHTLFHGPDGPVNGFLRHRSKTDQGEKLSATGILRDDGQTLIPPTYAWVAERYDLDDPQGAWLVARALDQAWSQNQPVQAAPREGNEYQWLTRDGGVIGHAQALQAKFAQGDFNAAWQLAQDYRDGVGLPADAAQAHRWALRAAGQSTAAAPPPQGFLSRVFGQKTHPDHPRSPNPHAVPAAIGAVAAQLLQPQAGEDAHRAGRAWLEHGLTLPQGAASPLAFQMTYALQAGAGGQADPAQALTWYLKAAEQGDTEAHFRAGLLYAELAGGPPMSPRAPSAGSRPAATGKPPARTQTTPWPGLPRSSWPCSSGTVWALTPTRKRPSSC